MKLEGYRAVYIRTSSSSLKSLKSGMLWKEDCDEGASPPAHQRLDQLLDPIFAILVLLSDLVLKGKKAFYRRASSGIATKHLAIDIAETKGLQLQSSGIDDWRLLLYDAMKHV